MPVAEVCRLTAESGDRLSIAFVVVGSRVPLSRLQQAALAFPVDTAVVAVICDERAHPRMQPLVGTHRAHGRHARRPVGPAAAGGDVMSERDAVIRPPNVRRLVVPRVRRGIGLRRRGRRPRGHRGVADLPLVALRGCWSGSAPPSPRGIAVVAWRRRWCGLARRPLCSALASSLARRPARGAVAAGRPGRDPAGSRRAASAGVVLGWKDLVTVDLPVGSYRNLLVPALVVFLVGTCVAAAAVVARGRRRVRGRARRRSGWCRSGCSSGARP